MKIKLFTAEFDKADIPKQNQKKVSIKIQASFNYYKEKKGGEKVRYRTTKRKTGLTSGRFFLFNMTKQRKILKLLYSI